MPELMAHVALTGLELCMRFGAVGDVVLQPISVAAQHVNAASRLPYSGKRGPPPLVLAC